MYGITQFVFALWEYNKYMLPKFQIIPDSIFFTKGYA